MKRASLCLVVLLGLAATAAADEIRLKDGRKIMGTIVGFEGDSFKIETDFGFAMVRKDAIAAIIPTAAKTDTKTEAKTEPKKDAAPKKSAKAAATSAVIPASASAPAAAPAPNREAPPTDHSAAPNAAPSSATAASPATPPAAPASVTANATASPDRQAPAAVAPPPVVMHEEVQGNTYVNFTYGFRMYKAPGWHVIEGAQKALPTAIVAMGTSDETTLLVVGRERTKESIEARAAVTERQLRELYQNYRRISEQHTQVAGLPALERRFRGTVDDHDWSGVVVSLERGADAFTIIGLTYATSDLIQIQENVISKTIASLDFSTR